MRFLLAFCVSVLCVTAAQPKPEDKDKEPVDEEDYSLVTCGSTIKLMHVATGYRLHSHEIPYGGQGSGQQSVTCFPNAEDPNSLWVVKGAHGSQCKRGSPIACGSVIRLEHTPTRKNLHSHLFKSPLSNQQEVSAFGDSNGVGDTGDNWRVECSTNKKSKSENWVRGAPVRFVHVDTGRYLHSNPKYRFGNPIPGQQEVSAYDKKDKLNEWSTKEGVYIASDKPQASTKHAPPAATPAAPPKSEAKNATGAQQPAK